MPTTLSEYLPKNDVILFSRKRFCALGLGSELDLELAKIFGQKSIWASVLDPPTTNEYGNMDKALRVKL